MTRFVSTIVAILLTMVVSTGCQSWQATTASPESLAADARDDAWRLSVRGTEGTLVIEDVSVDGDSIYGQGEFGPAAVPRDAVSQIEVQRFSLARTIVLPVVAFGLYQIYSTAFSGDPVQ